MKNKIKIVVVDDSALDRGLILRAMEKCPAVDLVGDFMHGEAFLSWVGENRTDIVILDTELPLTDSLETLSRLRASHPEIKVIMSSRLTHKENLISVNAMLLGAVDCITKPRNGTNQSKIKMLSEQLVPLVTQLGESLQILSVSDCIPELDEESDLVIFETRTEMNCQPELVLIHAGTGGPHAIAKILSDLPEEFQSPILISQKLPAVMLPVLAHHIEEISNRMCAIPDQTVSLEKNHVYLISEDFEMEIQRVRKHVHAIVHPEGFGSGQSESLDSLISSAAKVCGENLMAIQLSGSGKAGLAGFREVSLSDGFVITQDLATSPVREMPKLVIEEGLANLVLPVSQIGQEMYQITSGKICLS